MGELSKDTGAAGGGAVQWAAARWATATRADDGQTSVMNRSWHPLAMAKSSLTWRSALYLGVSLAWGLGWFVVLAVGLSLSVALLIIWVGLPLLALLMVAWRFGAVLERRFVLAAFGVRIPSPYRRMPEGRNPLSRLRGMAGDPATWKDLVYFAALLPITLGEFFVSAMVWAGTGTLLFLPVIVAVVAARRSTSGSRTGRATPSRRCRCRSWAWRASSRRCT
ncbi:sensor domain-containing protein [Actinomadura luteofluorescens]|uniref:sensor domain-containing protein n=1 Tax=Actinomadura luteofluorescens TaxID=46163 RepID=UPI00362AD0DD